MKKSFVILSIIIFSCSLYSQSGSNVGFSGNYIYAPDNQLKGVGYTINYQHHLRSFFYLEAGTSYALASRVIQRDILMNNVRLLDLAYQHVAYSFHFAPVVHVAVFSGVSIDVYAGPAVTYQSNVFDKNHYELQESSGYVSSITGIVYANEVVEGVFFGGSAGCRINIDIGPEWLLTGGVSANGILHAVSTINASIGVKYCW